MSESFFNNARELIDAFGIRDNSIYSKITPLNDRKVGFSAQRNYPADIMYAPLVNKKGEDDTVALMHVVYSHPTEDQSDFNSHKVPLIVRITTHSKYRENHIDYDFEDAESPTMESIERTKTTPTPLALDYVDEFFYDHHTKVFVDSTLDTLTGEQILERVFDEHCSTSHYRRGRSIRRRLKFQSILVDILALIISLFKWILINVFGRTIDDSNKYFAYLTGYDRESFKKLSTESLDVFGYKTSRRVIILFCFIVAIVYLLKYAGGIDWFYLRGIFSNSFLALTHSLIILWVLDVVIPEMLFVLINWTTNIRTNLAFRKFKI